MMRGLHTHAIQVHALFVNFPVIKSLVVGTSARLLATTTSRSNWRKPPSPLVRGRRGVPRSWSRQQIVRPVRRQSLSPVLEAMTLQTGLATPRNLLPVEDLVG